MGTTTSTAAPAIAGEVIKLAPIGGSLVVYGWTLQEWTILFGCLYAAGLLVDLVVRRWLVPFVRHILARRGARRAESGSQL